VQREDEMKQKTPLTGGDVVALVFGILIGGAILGLSIWSFVAYSKTPSPARIRANYVLRGGTGVGLPCNRWCEDERGPCNDQIATRARDYDPKTER